MQSESRIDPKIIEEVLKFSKNIIDAPKLVSAPDEIDLEVTPHKVVQQIDKTRLLHYAPLTERKYDTPLLISYALINRYHILDIHPQKSWVRNLLEQGFDVYMLDWGTPTSMDKYLDFDDYVNGYLDTCVEFVKNQSSSEKISLQGYCTGATIATAYTALHPENVKNYVATAPVIDGWKDTTVISNLAKHMDADKMVDIIKTQTNYWDTIIKTRTQTFIFNDILPDRRIIDKILWEMHEHCPSKQRKAPYRIDVLDWSNQQLRRDIYAGTYTPDESPDRFNSQTLAPYLLVFSKRNLSVEEIGLNDELNDWIHFHNVAWNEIGMASTFIALSALSKGIDSGFCACIRNAKEICKEFPNMEQKDGPLLYMGLGYRSNAKTYMCPIKGTEEEIFDKDWLHKGVVHDRKPPFQKYIGFNEYK